MLLTYWFPPPAAPCSVSAPMLSSAGQLGSWWGPGHSSGHWVLCEAKNLWNSIDLCAGYQWFIMEGRQSLQHNVRRRYDIRASSCECDLTNRRNMLLHYYRTEKVGQILNIHDELKARAFKEILLELNESIFLPTMFWVPTIESMRKGSRVYPCLPCNNRI